MAPATGKSSESKQIQILTREFGFKITKIHFQNSEKSVIDGALIIGKFIQSWRSKLSKIHRKMDLKKANLLPKAAGF